MNIRHARLVLSAVFLTAGCQADGMITPTDAPHAPLGIAAKADAVTGETAEVSPLLASMNATLASSGANVRIAKAELFVDGATWSGSSQTLIADDRSRGIGAEWVAGDPRRDGRVGVSYAFDPRQGRAPFTRNPDGSGLRQVQFAELEPILETSMDAWRGRSCSQAPITRVAVAPGVDPDFIDNLFLGSDGVGRPYAQVSDVVQGGWQSPNFFTALAGPAGNGIIGVAFTLVFVDGQGNPTDIDRNGKDDTGLSEIYYNTAFAWGSTEAPNVVDFYSIITHETGHAMGLGHFGKVFVTKKDTPDGIQIADVKYAPKALMNAVYITGRSEIAGTDNSSFCQIWGSKK